MIVPLSGPEKQESECHSAVHDGEWGRAGGGGGGFS